MAGKDEDDYAGVIKSNKDLDSIMSQERLDVIKKGRAPMMFPQYVSLLKSRAHELDAVEGKTGSGRSRYQSIHNTERDAAEAVTAVAAVVMAAVEDAVMVALGVEMTRRKSRLAFLKRSISSFQPRSRKRSTKQRMLQRKAVRRNTVNQAETVVPSSISVTMEATGIMGAVTGGRLTASDIR